MWPEAQSGMTVPLAARALLAAFIVAQACTSKPPTKFEELHLRGLKLNPPDVTLHLETRDGRTTLQTSDIISLKLLFSSSKPNIYTVQIEDLGHGDAIVFQRVDTTEPSRLTNDHGAVCCVDNREVLGQKPVAVPSYLHFRLPAGKYSMFLQTNRVSSNLAKRGRDGADPMITSDVLQIAVLPDH
jgi:hypothetical protein